HDYWYRNGGLPIFGYPISEEFQELSRTDGEMHTVQYFERARFEWHPDKRGTPYEFLLGHLGREILIARGWLKGAYYRRGGHLGEHHRCGRCDARCVAFHARGG